MMYPDEEDMLRLDRMIKEEERKALLYKLLFSIMFLSISFAIYYIYFNNLSLSCTIK
jgi:hypothetical protein